MNKIKIVLALAALGVLGVPVLDSAARAGTVESVVLRTDHMTDSLELSAQNTPKKKKQKQKNTAPRKQDGAPPPPQQQRKETPGYS